MLVSKPSKCKSITETSPSSDILTLTTSSIASALHSSPHSPHQDSCSTSESLSIKSNSNTFKSKSLQLSSQDHLLKAISKLDSTKATVSKSARSTTNRKSRKQKQHQEWVPSLGLLLSDRQILTSKTGWLTDTIINGAQILLKSYSEEQKNLQGFQNTLLGQKYLFSVFATDSRPFVQILHINNNHWITATDVGCEPGNVYIYDSMHQYITLNCKKQICSFLKPKQKVLNFCLINMQSQTDSSSCGLFAIAVATALTYGIDPSCCNWEVSKMRQHLLLSLENQKLEKFPTHKEERRVCPGSKITKKIKEQIFCKCRSPIDPRLGMIQCVQCKELYHLSCCDISVPPRSGASWTCTECMCV